MVSELKTENFIYLSTFVCINTFVEVLNMKRVTFSMPKELKEKLDKHPDINWSEVVKEGIRKWVAKLEKFEELENKGGI